MTLLKRNAPASPFDLDQRRNERHEPGDHFRHDPPASDLLAKTIQKHVYNLWVPGDEFIRDLNDGLVLDKAARRSAPFRNVECAEQLLDQGGDDQQRSFYSTSRKLRRYLTAKAR